VTSVSTGDVASLRRQLEVVVGVFTPRQDRDFFSHKGRKAIRASAGDRDRMLPATPLPPPILRVGGHREVLVGSREDISPGVQHNPLRSSPKAERVCVNAFFRDKKGSNRVKGSQIVFRDSVRTQKVHQSGGRYWYNQSANS